MNFFSRYKKLFFLIGFVGVSILIGVLMWKTFFTAEIGPQAVDPDVNYSGNLPGAAEGEGQIVDGDGNGGIPGSDDNTLSPEQTNNQNIPGRDLNIPSPVANGGLTNAKNVSGAPISNPSLSKNSISYYNEIDDKFYRLDANGNIVAINDKAFPGVKNVVWSPNNEKAVLEYPDGTKSVYNFNTDVSTILPSHWEEFSFSPDSNKISSKSLGQDVDNKYLIVSNDDGSKAKAIEYIGVNAKDVTVDWSPNNQVAATYVKGLDFDRKEVVFIGFNGENMKSMTVQGRGFQSQWSPAGDKMLYSVYNSGNDMKPKLWLATTENGEIGSLTRGITLETWSSKCTFANNDEVYCAVPKNLAKGAGLFPESADSTNDDLYKINLKTGSKSMIAIPSGNHTISQIIVSDGQNKLYFTDKQTNELYQINLK